MKKKYRVDYAWSSLGRTYNLEVHTWVASRGTLEGMTKGAVYLQERRGLRTELWAPVILRGQGAQE